MKTRQAKEPMFLYTSVCCQVPAAKGACEMPKDKGIRAFGEKPEGEASLGSWRCSDCRRPCKVSRSVNSGMKARATQIKD